MSNSFLGPKPVRSVAAFLWMPQIRLSFQHMSHLTPVFIRTLAMVFVQAGLLPRNHPATLYGFEGIKKYRFSELIGEAWFTLRTTRATPSQWGLFAAVMLMISMIIGSMVTFLVTVAMGFGTPAQAQLFSHPNGSSAMTAAYTPAGPFDVGIPDDSTANSDYGIMMLNKVIRAGAYGEGTPMQNATRALMEIYNSGVLVVASVILFWIIISVVVDTAKTGQVGGGRHNMVWAPMRIVFALGLLIPLGTAGYSSGQYMIMKLAEWGSNLGTRAWVAYANSIVSSQNLVANSSPLPIADIVVGYQKMWVCRMGHNANEANGTGTPDPQQLVTAQPSSNFTNRNVIFTNQVSTNLCGTMSYEYFSSSDVDLLRGQIFASGLDDMLANITTFRQNMRSHYHSALVALDGQMSNLACRYVAGFPQYNGVAVPGCGISGTGVYPPQSDLQNLIDTYATSIKNRFDAELVALQTAANGSGMMAEIQKRGWAGMGIWYHRIAQLNAAVASVQQSSVTITEGEIMTMDVQASTTLQNTRDMLRQFDEWWVNSLVASASTQPDPLTGQAPVNDPQPSSSAVKKPGILSALRAMTDPRKLMDLVVDSISVFTNSWMLYVMDGSTSATANSYNTYPLSVLSHLGGNIFWVGFSLFGGTALFQLFVGAYPGGFADNVVFPLLAKLGTAMMVAGMVLKFYIPIIPFIRTAFAVLTWIISVFEAVALVPIAALAHLSTEGEGLAGSARQAWILWLNVLMRPVLTVVGFVGAMLVFNSFVTYLNSSFFTAATMGLPSGGLLGLMSGVMLAIIYVFIMYTAANTVFKMLDLIPNALMRWMGGQADTSFDDGGDRNFAYLASGMINGTTGPRSRRDPTGRGGGPGVSQAPTKQAGPPGIQ